MSGWLPLSYKIKKVGTHVRHPLQTDHAHHMPVFWGHGELDDVVHLRWAEESIAHLTDLGFENIEYNVYPYLKHDMGKEEKQDLEDWLAKLLPPT
ncbi:hypothetical protein Rhopal_000885-T1 [Rhodotorula paludigena]|uniref:Acyl-protein thioesterase 1 n=1 Tax=Rhodotorula paludigena TaxID=86838 RepID=A0AAV5GE66_9BASI|nr:hypothetical protein Rhopal_000885-T1 [Rhodotorula paludigena]